MKIVRSGNPDYKKDHVAIKNLYCDGWMRIGYSGLRISNVYPFDDYLNIIGVDLI